MSSGKKIAKNVYHIGVKEVLISKEQLKLA